jgi:hypothetical protein
MYGVHGLRGSGTVLLACLGACVRACGAVCNGVAATALCLSPCSRRRALDAMLLGLRNVPSFLNLRCCEKLVFLRAAAQITALLRRSMLAPVVPQLRFRLFDFLLCVGLPSALLPFPSALSCFSGCGRRNVKR